ncbi:Ima1-N domain-containing protein [Mycena chlorophos]|uniref:Ima1-N domain-containing protein n=1 Tax=Mycena chlorophos TaxID=658473 RepID=A0A8H6T2C6_MYCCL|nr:Ima1-N domain-containing protein [Mycena chlorophos]
MTSSTVCFFCNATVPAHSMATGFQCPKCDAYNRFVNGNLADPAIFDESFNSRPFALRAGRNNHRLPPQFGTIRCSNCQRNATLVVQLLANYDDDNIEEYREALYSRYPLVCDSCSAEVEEEITRKDTMARSKALAGWLSQTKGKEQRRQVLAPQRESEKLSRQLLAWRIRGLLWAATALLSVLSCVSAAVGFWPWTFKSPAPLLCLNILSLFWAFWDPTYASYSSAKLQGRDVRLKGKKNHITLQLTSWTSRVVTALLLNGYSSLRIDPLHLSAFPSTPSRVYFGFTAIIELSSAILPFFVLRLQRPPAIRLIDTSRHKLESRSPTPAPVASSSALEADLFAGLSFSSKPILTPPSQGRTGLWGLVDGLTVQRQRTYLGYGSDGCRSSPSTQIRASMASPTTLLCSRGPHWPRELVRASKNSRRGRVDARRLKESFATVEVVVDRGSVCTGRPRWRHVQGTGMAGQH